MVPATDRVTRNYGQWLLETLRQLFRVVHRRDRMTPAQFQQALERTRKRVLEVGRQWYGRIWTVIATLTQQGRSVFAYLDDAIHTYLHHQPAPALLAIKP